MRDESRPRWQGDRGRMEVWYATCTENEGTGWWFHHERLVPQQGEPFVHGWAAVFPPGGPPLVERFGPGPDASDATSILGGEGWRLDRAGFSGKTSRIAWDVGVESGSPALYTFPRWSWEREVLPGAQIVDVPCAAFDGTVSVDGIERALDARGAQAHIFSHGSAAEWGWLHADLDEETTLEIVAAVPHLPGGLAVPPRPVVRLRHEGRDVPRDSLATALVGRARVSLPRWSARVPIGAGRTLDVSVEMPPNRCIQLEYPNPDGSRAYCTNTERADLHVEVQRGRGRRRTVEREWDLTATAHAEVGRDRPWDEVDVLGFPA